MIDSEVRFLLRGCDIAQLRTFPSVRISQGFYETYVGDAPDISLWVSIASDRETLIGLTKDGGVLRYVFVQHVDHALAEHMLSGAHHRVDKTRFLVSGLNVPGVTWSIDVYEPPFKHILIAEHDVVREPTRIEAPDWFGPLEDVTTRLTSLDIARAQSALHNRDLRQYSQKEAVRFSEAAALLDPPK